MASASRRLKYLQHWYKDGGILLMSYEQFRISVLRESHDRDLIRTMLVDPGPAILIADEAHRIKNSTSQLTIALQLVKTRARLCLTGSPLQNNLLEFYHVVEFACPNYLPAQQEFNHLYLKPIQNVYADSPASNIYMAKKQLFKLQLLTADIILRRDTTILAKELPKKIEYYVGCKLKELQYKGYESLLHLFKHTDIQENPMINLCVLRAICNHPSVLNQMAVGRQDKVMPVPTISTQRNHELEESDIALEEEMMEISTAIKTTQLMAMAEKLFDTIPDIDDPRHSSKTEVIVGIATACRDANDKLVIVSHSILCLDYLENLLGTLQFQTARIDGSTPATERQPIIETFNNSTTQHIMFLSARAGSLGVNITGANRMILCDSDWNPQHDEQGVGRVYRYGQTKDVFIYRLYTYTTIEHKLLYQSIHKRGIASRVVDNDKLSLQDKHEMRKYYALPQRNPSSNTNRILSKIQDPVLRKVIEENASDVADAVSKETLERDGVQAETELEIADIEKARKEVKGYQQLYYSTKSKRSSGGRDSYSDIL
ncbi:P-loop containing nucleoside triphosphate hydrolase protein [Zychaea mexicana]|uniref:P-loop containing nucleoside triphosphate hydrolase protein n=1 Tax=Zychaea mexicana TaxID=64656 RepID=UPI0022FDEBA5|nr:P-loop containing nucleoside triphosphate hydrolase protein [Zychaea mexicana]KAI9490382.1 P-loop containing nucleoside triphosphate hydrolase protein [Zychaea mexicana]